MQDKRTALAVLLCMFVLMFWMELVMAPYNRRPLPNNNQPNTQTNQSVQPQNQNTSPVNVNNNNAPATQQPVVQVKDSQAPNHQQVKDSGEITIESAIYKFSVANLGARITTFQLKEHKASLGGDIPLDLVVTTEGSPFPLGVQVGTIKDDHVLYRLAEVSSNLKQQGNQYQIAPQESASLKFVGKLTPTIDITKTIKISGQSYLLGVDVSLSSPSPDGSRIWLQWTHFDATHQVSQHLNHNYYTVLGVNNKIALFQMDAVLQPVMELGQNQWVSFGDKYFMASLISPSPGSDIRIGRTENIFQSQVSAGTQNGTFHVFLGPKSHNDLAKTGFQLERNVDLGWFAFVAHPLLGAIKFFYTLLGNYGLAIILLTLLIKALFLPLTKTSFKSMKAMQELQPEMKALRERIQDPNQLNKEIMALYKKHGVNPMGGCFPILIQLPVFLGLYNALNYSIELRHAPFALWINDLSSPEHLDFMGIGIPVMVLLMGASMFIQQWTTPSAADPQQKKIMMMMPIIFTISFVIFPFPSGLVLYWLVNNLISIIQQINLRGQSSGGGSLQGTVIASIIIFGVGYLLTLI